MKMNNIQRSNKVRSIHRYLGFFLTGIMFMYALSGITLTYRATDTLKQYNPKQKIIEKGLEVSELPELRLAKDVEYNKETGELNYLKAESPKLIGMMEKMHKATTNSPLYFFNIFFGVSLLFFVFSAYWMYLPQTNVFKKAIYFTIGGIILSLIMILV